MGKRKGTRHSGGGFLYLRRIDSEKTEELSGLSVEDREESVAEKQKETIQQLNEKQKQAAETIARRIAVAAGPGTGKQRL